VRGAPWPGVQGGRAQSDALRWCLPGCRWRAGSLRKTSTEQQRAARRQAQQQGGREAGPAGEAWRAPNTPRPRRRESLWARLCRRARDHRAAPAPSASPLARRQHGAGILCCSAPPSLLPLCSLGPVCRTRCPDGRHSVLGLPWPQAGRLTAFRLHVQRGNGLLTMIQRLMLYFSDTVGQCPSLGCRPLLSLLWHSLSPLYLCLSVETSHFDVLPTAPSYRPRGVRGEIGHPKG